MHHRIGIEARKNLGNGQTIADVGAAELISWVGLHRSEEGEVAGIGYFVDDQNLMISLADEISHQRRSNKARSAREQNLHKRTLPRLWNRQLYERMTIILKWTGEFLKEWKSPILLRDD